MRESVAYVNGGPGAIQPFSVEDAIDLTAAQARARFRPAPPSSNHERWLRSVADEFKQTRGKKNNVVDILSRFKPVESGVESCGDGAITQRRVL